MKRTRIVALVSTLCICLALFATGVWAIASTVLFSLNGIQNYTNIEEEIADVFIVLVSICNELGINLYDAVINKEKDNIKRKWETPK